MKQNIDCKLVLQIQSRSKIQDVDRPWLDRMGMILSDSAIRGVSKKWSPEIWERFLLETVEGSNSYCREEVLSRGEYLNRLDQMTDSMWECALNEESDSKADLVRRLIRDFLSPRQQQIIRLVFWDGLNDRAIAAMLNISRSNVAAQKRRSFKKLKGLLEKRMPDFCIDEREKRKMEHVTKTRSEDISEVYQSEIARGET